MDVLALQVSALVRLDAVPSFFFSFSHFSFLFSLLFGLFSCLVFF